VAAGHATPVYKKARYLENPACRGSSLVTIEIRLCRYSTVELLRLVHCICMSWLSGSEQRIYLLFPISTIYIYKHQNMAPKGHRLGSSSMFAQTTEPIPLPTRFARIKKDLIEGKQDQIKASWTRLLVKLKTEIDLITTRRGLIFTLLSILTTSRTPQ